MLTFRSRRGSARLPRHVPAEQQAHLLRERKQAIFFAFANWRVEVSIFQRSVDSGSERLEHASTPYEMGERFRAFNCDQM